MKQHIDIDLLRESAAQGCIEWHKHALERMLERGIARREVVDALVSGEVIEVYPKDRPFLSCLILRAETKPLHTVAAVDPETKVAHVITAYRPDTEHFEPDFRTRR